MNMRTPGDACETAGRSAWMFGAAVERRLKLKLPDRLACQDPAATPCRCGRPQCRCTDPRPKLSLSGFATVLARDYGGWSRTTSLSVVYRPADAISIAAATAALADQEYARKTWDHVKRERERLAATRASRSIGPPTLPVPPRNTVKPSPPVAMKLLAVTV